ncbi:auxin-responsive protein IAA9-like [Brassica napus]|uniref:auxin-responsive protein IAA9-like n=1 Tax=Brassica napus TaxID=3708 RepID=UPI0006AA6F7B|nr:auxin-responsive protein IAA9-like [Brassica napus]
MASSSPTAGGGLKKHNYLGISDCSSYYAQGYGSDTWLPGSRSLVRDTDLHLLSYAKLDERPFLPLVPLKDEICPFSSLKNIASGNKSSVYTEKKWTFPEGVASQYVMKKDVPRNVPKGHGSTTNNSSSPPAAK